MAATDIAEIVESPAEAIVFLEHAGPAVCLGTIANTMRVLQRVVADSPGKE